MTEYFLQSPEFYEGAYWEHPVAARFLDTDAELGYTYHKGEDTLVKAIINIKESLMDWVSAGLICQWVTRKRLWQEQYSTWQDFCIQALNKQPYQVKNLMEAAEAVKYLAQYGFTLLPTNLSQVASLLRCVKKLDCLLEEAWEKVVETLPANLITANSISEILGFPMKNTKITVPIELRDRLSQKAQERGVSLKQMLKEDYGLEEEQEEVTEEEEIESVEPEAIEAWSRDVKALIQEHDKEIWLLTSLIKLASLVKQAKSQFHFLIDRKMQLVS